MGRTIDRTGQKFNMLTIVQELGEGRVLVSCDCGNIKECRKSRVVSGSAKSCGCTNKVNKAVGRVKSKVGQKFGYLTISRELGGGRVIAVCVCGVVKEYEKAKLVNGSTKGCGCLQSKSRIYGIVGQKFNMLTVVTVLSGSKVEARCDCGTVKEYNKSCVVNGNTKSCGCKSRSADRAGQKFGKLTITKELGELRVEARCDCGTVKEYSKANVVRGSTKSCGCLIPKTRIYDRTGQKFGVLTIVRELGGGRVVVRCDCGNTKEYDKNSVARGLVESCGCLRDKTGHKFNSLTIIEELGRGKVLAKCDCGSIKEYIKANILNGHTKSCGCLKRGVKI